MIVFMEGEPHTDTNCGSSRQNPVIVSDSPQRRLNRPKKRLRNETQQHIQDHSPVKKVKKEVRSPAGHSSTSLHLEEVSFELYSHATDPVRSVESVHTVAGIPLTLQQGKLGEFCNRTQHEDTSMASFVGHITQPSLTSSLETQPTLTSSSLETQPSLTSSLETQQRVDADSAKPFNKSSRGLLDTLSDLGSNTLYNLARYVQLLEALLSQRSFIPADHLPQVLTLLMNSHNEFVNRFHFVLSQDLVLRDSSMPTDDFIHDTLCKLVQTLDTQHNHTPSLVTLHYIVGLLDKNKGQWSLKKRIHSLQSKVLDLVFSAVSQTELPPSLACLPSLTTTLITLLSLLFHDERTLAETISDRLDHLPTTGDKCYLLRCLPSQSLRETVIDLHLEWFFMSTHSDCSPVRTLKDISKKHFRRRPYRPNGVPHDVSFFLSLLCMIVESHLKNDAACQEGLSDLQIGVHLLTNTLYDDPLWVVKLSECNVWLSLQLLTVLTAV